jgi:hypothetical protein
LKDLIYTMADAARVVGLSRTSVYRLRAIYADDFPSLPTFRFVLTTWATKRGIPRKRGLHRSLSQSWAVDLRREGATYADIGRTLHITKQAAWALCKRSTPEGGSSESRNVSG